MLHSTLLVAVILASQAASEAQPDLGIRVAQQVQRIKDLSGSSEARFFELPETSISGGPVTELIGYGMDAIPYLIPHLADTSLTKANRVHGSGMTRQVAVNEYVIYIIDTIASHNFYPSSDTDGQQDVCALQTQVLSWWRENRSKRLIERKIADINDRDHPNRFSAYEWLGRERTTRGRLPLERRITTLLSERVDSLRQSEMVACADSLARIGDTDSATVVREVCNHLSYWFSMSYKPIEQGRSARWSGQIDDLFKAYHALALLGFRDDSLTELRKLGSEYLGEMEPSAGQEFLQNLEKAEHW